MRNVLKTSELPHAWAHQTQRAATCPGNMSFDNALVRSYGTGIARHVVNKRGPAIVFNVTSYSVTTSRHQGKIGQSFIPGVPVFRIGDVPRSSDLRDYSGPQLFDYAIKQAEKARASVGRVKSDWKRDSLAAEESRWLQQAREVARFYGMRRKVDEKAIERLAEAEGRAKAREAKARKLAEKARDAKLAEDVARWQAGENVGISVYSFSRVLLRSEGAEVVTSRGARVPLADAERTFRFALAARERGWHRNGDVHKVGTYQLDVVNNLGVIANCHRIDWAEIERFGKAMGWA
jgi:hypothetical protein